MLKSLKRRWISWLKWSLAVTIPLVLAAMIFASYFGMAAFASPRNLITIIFRGRILVVDDTFFDDFGLDWSDTWPISPPLPSPPTSDFALIKPHGFYPAFARFDDFQSRLLFRVAAISSGVRSLPLWPALALSLLWPTLKLRRVYLSRKTDQDAIPCPTCNYDLRATPLQCPECGNVPPVKTRSAASASSF